MTTPQKPEADTTRQPMKGKAVPLIEQLRSVPRNAVLRIDTPNALGVDTRSIPVGPMCHEAAFALSAATPESAEPWRSVKLFGAPNEKEPIVYARPNPRRPNNWHVGIAYWTVSEKWAPEAEAQHAPTGFTHWFPLPSITPGERIAAPVQATPPYADSTGYALAMRVMQSNLYPSLDSLERAECDEFIRRGQAKESAPTQAAPQGLSDDEIEEIAERMGATDPKDSFWKEFARAFLSASTSQAAPVAPSNDEGSISVEMMEAAARKGGFDPIPGRLIKLAGILNGMLAASPSAGEVRPSDDEIRKVWNRTQDPIATVRAFLPAPSSAAVDGVEGPDLETVEPKPLSAEDKAIYKRIADGYRVPPVTLTAEDAHFLAVRLRRLCAHLNYTLPKFANDDAKLVNIAGTVIGALLTQMREPFAYALRPKEPDPLGPLPWRFCEPRYYIKRDDTEAVPLYAFGVNTPDGGRNAD